MCHFISSFVFHFCIFRKGCQEIFLGNMKNLRADQGGVSSRMESFIIEYMEYHAAGSSGQARG